VDRYWEGLRPKVARKRRVAWLGSCQPTIAPTVAIGSSVSIRRPGHVVTDGLGLTVGERLDHELFLRV
jgi:hypothetical protein